MIGFDLMLISAKHKFSVFALIWEPERKLQIFASLGICRNLFLLLPRFALDGFRLVQFRVEATLLSFA